jgi:aryl-alcohol dehydrogenase-like predicted oxidoreductase
MTASLPTRKIGAHDVSAIGYGAMGIAAFYGAVESDEERFKVRAPSISLDNLGSGSGGSCIAPSRTNAQNYLIRRFKRTGKRDDIFLASKFGITGDPKRPANGTPAYVKACFEKSRSRLGGT